MEPAVDTFLKTVLRSGLLGADELKAAYRVLPREQRRSPRQVADQLVKTGKLSRFQARKLLAGTPMGLKFGPYQILAPIGRGAMGAVYLARDSRDQQLVALKVLPHQEARTEERKMAECQREIHMSQSITYTHKEDTNIKLNNNK